MSGYLTDTHIIYWFRLGWHHRLTAPVVQLMEDIQNDVYYSVVNPWELSIKCMKGKLSLPDDFLTTLPNLGFDCMPIEEKHVETLRTLPRIHDDLFDRMLVAQAISENMTLITADKHLLQYPVKLLTVD